LQEKDTWSKLTAILKLISKVNYNIQKKLS